MIEEKDNRLPEHRKNDVPGVLYEKIYLRLIGWNRIMKLD